MAGDRGGWKLRLMAGGWTLAVIALMAAAMIRQPELLVTLRHAVFDNYQKLRPRVYVPAPVRIVDIDEQSLDRLGQWPWPRNRMAQLVRRLDDLGAAVIAFDVIMAEPDRSSPLQAVANWQLSGDLAARLAELPDHDAQFAAAIEGRPVVLGFALRDGGGGAPTKRAPKIKARFVRLGGKPDGFFQQHDEATLPLALLEEAAAGIGAVAFTPDSDGIVRKVPLVYGVGGKLAPSLAAEALRVAQGQRNIFIKMAAQEGSLRNTGIEEVKIGSAVIPTGANGEAWLYYTPREPARFVSAWRVLAGEVAAEKFAGQIVLIGTSAAGLKDLRFTALGELVPGVEIHAQFLEQVTTRSFLVRPGWWLAAESLSMLAAAVAVALAVSLAGALLATAISAALLAAVIAGAWYAFAGAALLLDPSPAVIALLAVFIGCSIIRYVASERRQRWIHSAFASYVSPNLVDHIIASPERLTLGGERRVCSFVFTDLAGFTTLMEAIDPARAVDLLNDYLDEMVAIAFRHGGTLDRIVGDAVAVMFSAPLVQEDHADLAVRCALEMDAFASEFATRQQADGLAFGHTRIGVNTGEVIIGNFGGRTIFDYRALGDPVNTASRLEGANKYTGTRVCVSGATVAACSFFVGRPIGELLLKGKKEPVMAYEPSAEGLADEEYAAAYDHLASGHAEAAAQFRALAKARPDDPLVRLHLDRIADGALGVAMVLDEK